MERGLWRRCPLPPVPLATLACVVGAGAPGLFLRPITTRPLSKAARRWRAAFGVIYFCRGRARGLAKILSRSPSYLALDILDNGDEGTAFAPTPDASASAVPLELKLAVVSAERLAELVKGQRLDGLRDLGGVEGVAASLVSNLETGVDGDDDSLRVRRKLFGSNTYRKPSERGFPSFVWEAFKDDPMLVILLLCAALSLVFDFQKHGVRGCWLDDVSTLVAVFLVVSVSAVANFRAPRTKFSDEFSNSRIRVIREGRQQDISVFDVVVGDIVCLQAGDQVPADGLLLGEHSLQVGESSVTAESNHATFDGCSSPFLTSGSNFADGYDAPMLVTSVGANTALGEMMSSTGHHSELTPLRERIQKLSSYIGKIGMAAAVLVFMVLLVRRFTGRTEGSNGHHRLDQTKVLFYSILTALVCIILDAVSVNGLPLSVILALAYPRRRIVADKARVRKLPALETMGSATAICTETGTLNQMQVTKFWMGDEEVKSNNKAINNVLLQLLYQAVGLDTTGRVHELSSTSEPEFSSSPTEKAIHSWAVEELGMDFEALKRRWEVLRVEAFSSHKKRSGVMARKRTKDNNAVIADNDTVTVHWKGSADMILAICSHYCNTDGIRREIDPEKRIKIGQVIEGMTSDTLNCIAFAYKHLEVSNNTSNGRDGDVAHKLEEDKLTLLGIAGLKDPVKACRGAGVAVKLITGENMSTAKSVALEHGILASDDHDIQQKVIEGKTFRNYSEKKRMEMVDKIQVMAGSSPLDKLLMVQCLKKKKHVVVVIGDGRNDALVRKEADVVLSLGIQGTEAAKESSDIVILDDNFASVFSVLMWGRCVHSNIQKFIQFRLTANIAALVLNLVAAVSCGKAPLTTIQQLWANVIMDAFGALALAKERPAKELAKKQPVGRSEPLITNVMRRDLYAQAFFQVAVLLILQFRGDHILGVDRKVTKTMIFNTFVLCQVFNEFNSRRLEKKNVFKGIHKSLLFLVIIATTLVLQFVMVEFMKLFAGTKRLDWEQWGFCIAIAFLSWPVGWALKCIPVSDKPIWELLKPYNIHNFYVFIHYLGNIYLHRYLSF